MILEIIHEGKLIKEVEVPDDITLSRLSFAARVESKMKRFGETFINLLVVDTEQAHADAIKKNGRPIEVVSRKRNALEKLARKPFRNIRKGDTEVYPELYRKEETRAPAEYSNKQWTDYL